VTLPWQAAQALLFPAQAGCGISGGVDRDRARRDAFRALLTSGLTG